MLHYVKHGLTKVMFHPSPNLRFGGCRIKIEKIQIYIRSIIAPGRVKRAINFEELEDP
jgi:hypothetical protein